MPTHYVGTRVERRTLNTYIKLSRCLSSLMTRVAQQKTFQDLTGSQFAVLEALYHLGPMSQGEISAKVLKSDSNLTVVVDHLERGELVRRERDATDRRVVRVSLTRVGSRKIAAILPGHVAALVDEFKVLSAGEQQMLGRLCKKLGKGRGAP